ncbi:GNAT family N-acetyltransferase [Filifactor villosus]|uniref:GNAT family N-acetyltransferase n=1 Tax=Filifactor villosus TaxID=29374 RepID=A0ABV9QM07_9FIRM
MDYNIRELKRNETKLLDTFLYEAIFIPEGVQAPSKDIIKHPDLQIYVADFGKKEDLCYVAEVEGRVVGAVWTRIINDYGHIDDETPSLSISLLKEYRNLGIGTELMKQILLTLKEQEYKQVSLSVQKANYAVYMYKKVGFEVAFEHEEDYIMICNLVHLKL